jgi:hypothetical protein
MKKRNISIDDVVYFIGHNGRVPFIKNIPIHCLAKNAIGGDGTIVTFREPRKGERGMVYNSEFIESRIYYTFKGESWDESCRGESYSYNCVYEQSRYSLSLETITEELKKRKLEVVEKIKDEIALLQGLLIELK